MTTGKGWRLVGPGKQAFKASLLKRMDIGSKSIAIFRVLPRPVLERLLLLRQVGAKRD